MEGLVAFPSSRFWSGKRVLVTGLTGFKGSWLAYWLETLGAQVSGLSLPPEDGPSLYAALHTERLWKDEFCDLRDADATARLVRDAKPEIVFHLAAQSLVRRGYSDPLGTFATNVHGTANLLDALKTQDDLRAVVVATTDKVYSNAGTGKPFVETDPLGGSDPYSASKVACEMVVAGYRASIFDRRDIGLATVRAGNVVGGGDWAEDRLIPDAIRAWTQGAEMQVRRPRATRPWQHVLEPLRGYMVLAEAMWNGQARETAYNFGPADSEAAAVSDVLAIAQAHLPDLRIVFGDGGEGPSEAAFLALNSSRAMRDLSVAARWPTPQTIDRTVGWYRAAREGGDARDLCEADLSAYRDDCGQVLAKAS